MKFSFKKQYVIGIDVGEHELAFIKLEKNRNIIEHAETAEFKHKQERLLILNSIVHKTNSRHQAAALALPAKNVVVKRIQLPERLTDNECQYEIKSNLSYYLPGMDEAICFDLVKLDTETFLLIAARTAALHEQIALIQQADLNIKVVDIDSYALIRGIAGCNPLNALAVLEISEDSGRLLIYQNPEVIFSETIQLEYFADQLKRALQKQELLHRKVRIETIIVCGSKITASILQQIQAQMAIPVYLANPFTAIKCAAHVDIEKLNHANPHLIKSLGLALRCLPLC